MAVSGARLSWSASAERSWFSSPSRWAKDAAVALPSRAPLIRPRLRAQEYVKRDMKTSTTARPAANWSVRAGLWVPETCRTIRDWSGNRLERKKPWMKWLRWPGGACGGTPLPFSANAVATSCPSIQAGPPSRRALLKCSPRMRGR